MQTAPGGWPDAVWSCVGLGSVAAAVTATGVAAVESAAVEAA
jgi:hypothetical protein